MHGPGSNNPLVELKTARVGGVGLHFRLALFREIFHIYDVTNFTFFAFARKSGRTFDLGTKGTGLGFGDA